jgi:hypothetical protein
MTSQSRQSSFASDTEEAEMSDERRAEIAAARELLRAWDARELSHPEHPATHRQWSAWMNEAADRLSTALDRVRDARGDDEVNTDIAVAQIQRAQAEAAARSPQSVDDEDDEWHYTTEKPSSPDCPMCGKPWRSPQGEDHEAADYHLLPDAPALAQCDICRRQSWALDEVGATCLMPQPSGAVCGGEMVGRSDGLVAMVRHLSRVSAPKADENQEASQNDERRH